MIVPEAQAKYTQRSQVKKGEKGLRWELFSLVSSVIQDFWTYLCCCYA